MDPDKLFEAMTVEEVKHMLQETRVNIERKKEELRFLVGERYRDIIEAADTISEMKMSAEKINGSLNRLNDVCQAWHKEIYLNGKISTVNTANDVVVDKSSNSNYSIASQVKFLLHMPELLWSAVERQEHSKAAVLYLSSRHVYTHIQMGGEMQSARINVLPLVTRQWNSLMQFREVVIRGSRQSMRRGYTPEAEICDALGSMVLLNDLSLEQVLEEYLAARKSAIEECVSCEDTSATVKQQICIGLELLLSTVHQIHDLFMVNADDLCLIQRSLNASVSEPLINCSELTENIFSYLPSTVSNFRPSLSHIKTKMSVEWVQTSTSKWFHSCLKVFSPAVRSLISHISALKSLNSIRDGVTTTLDSMTVEDKAWSSAAALVLDSSVDLWTICLKPIFMERLEIVMKSSFQSIFDWLSSEAEAMLEKDGGDLNAWLWSEQSSDVSIDAVWNAGARHAGTDLNPLGRKFSCFTPAVQSVISELNSKLQTLSDDLNLKQLVGQEKTEVQGLMVASLQSSLQQFVDAMNAHFAPLLLLPPAVARRRFLFLSRLCQAVIDICPALRQCLEPTMERPGRGIRGGSQKENAAWTEMAGTLATVANTASAQWLSRSFEEKARTFAKVLWSLEDVMAFLELCPRWEEVKLEEGASVRIPSHASWHVHKLLSDVCEELNAFGAHNIPRSVLLKCVNQLSTDLLSSFSSFLAEHRDSIPQPQILQLLFDVRFLFSILSPTSDTLEPLLRDLESLIDPFDLDVATGPMQSSLGHLCARCSLLYGLLVGLHDRLGTLTPMSSGGRSEEHQLLAKCGTGLRFMTLPSSSVRLVRTEEEKRGKKTSHKSNANSRRSSDIRDKDVKEENKNRLKDVYRLGSKLLKSVK